MPQSLSFKGSQDILIKKKLNSHEHLPAYVPVLQELALGWLAKYPDWQTQAAVPPGKQLHASVP